MGFPTIDLMRTGANIVRLYRVHSSAITKGRNSPDSNIADLICARRTQWRLERRIP